LEAAGPNGYLIRAYRLTTGPDGNSHVETGRIDVDNTAQARTIHFKETRAHASLDWHNAPDRQYVITLAGVLEFTTRGGETFTLRPGDVLVALDLNGTGHEWRLVDDEPWRRAYVTFPEGVETGFVPDR
jgi:quercetin dioxygenase-like cupin family protein